jgi:hypothetical protein
MGRPLCVERGLPYHRTEARGTLASSACGEDGASPPSTRISPRAFAAAAELVGDYFTAMAERVYGGITGTTRDRNATALARWILNTRPTAVHIRYLQREVRLPGLRTAEKIHEAADLLVAASWLCPPAPNTRFGPRARLSYLVNPQLCRPNN